MTEKFIKNEEFNFIKKQIQFIKDNIKKNVPKNVLNATFEMSNAKILEKFVDASVDQKNMLNISEIKDRDALDQYILNLSEYIIPFREITNQQLKKIFPKSKKLKLPDMSQIDLNKLTYLGWNDPRSDRKFIIYNLNDTIVGIESKFSQTVNKNFCSFCKTMGEVSYITTVTKQKDPKNPDYYKVIGNLVCVDSISCNRKITDVGYLSTYLKESLDM